MGGLGAWWVVWGLVGGLGFGGWFGVWWVVWGLGGGLRAWWGFGGWLEVWWRFWGLVGVWGYGGLVGSCRFGGGFRGFVGGWGFGGLKWFQGLGFFAFLGELSRFWRFLQGFEGGGKKVKMKEGFEKWVGV